MRKLLSVLLCLFIGISLATAQTTKVSGVVISAEDGEPIIGASVVAKGTTTGTVTNFDGQFSLDVPTATKLLSISYVGMKTQEVGVKPNLRVVLESASEDLDEVVVVGYGSARKVGTVVGSVAKVSSKTVESKPQASALEALQGQVPGLQVYSSSGDPGTVQSIRLHGIGSLTASNTPLYIVDGIQSTARDVLAMNPNDIESMSVLKDASATSIYGSRASNGVIYVTTKRGSSGNSKIQVRGQYGISSLADRSFYENMMGTQELWDFWTETGIRSEAQLENLKNKLVEQGQVRPNGDYNDYLWIDYMQKQNRPTTQADVAISGGNDNTQYYVSGSLYDQDGTAPGSYFKRYTLSSNVDSKVNKWFKFGLNLRLAKDERQTNSNYETNAIGGGLSFLLQPYYSPKLQDGSEPDYIPGLNRVNPYYQIRNNPDNYDRYGVSISSYLQIEPIKNLKVRVVPGVTGGIVLNSWHRNPSYISNLNNGRVGKSTQLDYIATITNTVEYMFTIKDDHRLTLLAGQEGIKEYQNYYYAQSSGQQDDRLLHLQNGVQSTYGMSSSDTECQFLSFFGRVDYSFLDRYFFDASVRNDACSRFGKDNRNATFWSVGGMWNITNEAFMHDLTWMNDLRLKVSYGTQGNSSIGNYSALATVSEITKYGEKPAWAISTPGNSSLAWEKQKKLTVGVNTRVFDMLGVGVEYYNRTTSDLLMNVPIPTTTGFENVMSNVGTLQNNGVDINVNVDILKGKDYYLGFNANFNYNSEKITKLFDGRKRWEIANTGVTYVVGKPIMFYYPIYAGVNPENGKMQWYVPGDDVDKTVKDPNNVTETFNERALTQNTGLRRYAPVAGGFGVTGSWKGISLNVDFAYVGGKNLISNDRYFSENPVGFAGWNTSKNVLDYWKKPGDVTEYPDWSKNPVMNFDTHLVENASFMRLKNLTVGYNLPRSILKPTKALTDVRIYVTGRNLWTVKSKDFKGIDPEVDSNLTMGRVGNSKQFVFGLDVTF